MESRCTPTIHDGISITKTSMKISDGTSIEVGGVVPTMDFQEEQFFPHNAIQPLLKVQQETAAFTFLSHNLPCTCYMNNANSCPCGAPCYGRVFPK